MGAKQSAVLSMRKRMQERKALEAAMTGSKVPLDYRNHHHQWTKLKTSGTLPSPRSGHDVVVIGHKAYLFGGCGGEQDYITCLNDIHVFDLELHHWSRVKVKGNFSPMPRASFGMCAGSTPGTFIVAGGTGVEVESLRADVAEFSVHKGTWRGLLTDSDETPCRLYGQSMCTYGESLLLFGGSTGLHYSNDLFEINTRTNKWKRLVTSGRKPSPRYKHQAVVAGHRMYVIGGGCFKPERPNLDIYCLDLRTLVWLDIHIKGEVPKARVAHSCRFDADSGFIFLWGGFTTELSRLQDFFGFHCPSATWVRINEETAQAPAAGGVINPAASPPSRAFHSAAFFRGSLYIFSGANGDVRYSDVWRFRFRSSPPTLAFLAAQELKSWGSEPLEGVELVVPAELIDGVNHMNEHAERLFPNPY